MQGADTLLPETEANYLIADKAYDTQERGLDVLGAKGIEAVIPPKTTRLTPRSHDTERYKDRHLIEIFFLKLKQFRANTTRYDKTARNFLAAIHLAASVILLA